MAMHGLEKITSSGPTAYAPPADHLTFAMPLGALTIGEAMQYLGTYLDKSDSEIRMKMNELQQRKEDAERLGQKITTLQTILRNADGDGWVRNKELVDKAHELFKNDPQLLNMLSPAARESLGRLDAHYNDTTYVAAEMAPPKGAPKDWTPPMIEVSDSKLHKDDIDAVVKALTEDASQMTSANELKMIQLQSAISARGNLLSMVSNMVKSFDDNAKSIVGNMR